MSDQLNAGATSETARTLKTIHNIHSLIHSNKVDMIRMIIMAKWYWEKHGDLKLLDIYLTGDEKPRKLVPTGDRTRACCVTDAHATASST